MNTPTPRTELDFAILFHETYERLAPSFGYETRPDTRAFDPESKNGLLMLAVMREVAMPLASDLAAAQEEIRNYRADKVEMQAQINGAEMRAFQAENSVAAAQEWREAVLNELIVAHIYTKEHDTNPRKAIQDAITWNCQVALDPTVSYDARKLVAQERERCAYICDRWSGVGDVVARAIAAAIRRG